MISGNLCFYLSTEYWTISSRDILKVWATSSRKIIYNWDFGTKSLCMSLWFQVPHTVSNLEGAKAVGAVSNKHTPARQVLKECRMLMMDWSYETWHWRFPVKNYSPVWGIGTVFPPLSLPYLYTQTPRFAQAQNSVIYKDLFYHTIHMNSPTPVKLLHSLKILYKGLIHVVYVEHIGHHHHHHHHHHAQTLVASPGKPQGLAVLLYIYNGHRPILNCFCTIIYSLNKLNQWFQPL